MKKLLLVIMFLIPCSICSFCFKRKATFFIDKNISKNTKIVYLQDRNLYLDINDYVFTSSAEVDIKGKILEITFEGINE